MTTPWMTRREAAEYLRCSVDSVDRLLVPMQGEPMSGKVRTQIVGFGQRKIRLWKEDVVALCPGPKGEETLSTKTELTPLDVHVQRCAGPVPGPLPVAVGTRGRQEFQADK